MSWCSIDMAFAAAERGAAVFGWVIDHRLDSMTASKVEEHFAENTQYDRRVTFCTR